MPISADWPRRIAAAGTNFSKQIRGGGGGSGVEEEGGCRDQLLEADTAAGGRFGLKEDADLGGLAQEDCVCRDQLLEADTAAGGRFELKDDADLGRFAQED